MTLDKPDSWSDDPAVSPIVFRLDPASGVPTYLQLVQQVENALRLGHLVTGDRLPRVREVVADLAINPNTVLKAYRELEHKGLASGRPGQGTFIEGSLNQATLAELAGLRRSLRAWLEDADAAGLDEDGIAALLTSTLRDFVDRRNASGVDAADDIGVIGTMAGTGTAGRASNPTNRNPNAANASRPPNASSPPNAATAAGTSNTSARNSSASNTSASRADVSNSSASNTSASRADISGGGRRGRGRTGGVA